MAKRRPPHLGQVAGKRAPFFSRGTNLAKVRQAPPTQWRTLARFGWQTPRDESHKAADEWQASGNEWQRTAGEWQRTVGEWRGAAGEWQTPRDESQRTAGGWRGAAVEWRGVVVGGMKPPASGRMRPSVLPDALRRGVLPAPAFGERLAKPDAGDFISLTTPHG